MEIMKLTKTEAIQEHRKMWEWIANFIEGKKTVCLPVCNGCFDIVDIKRKYTSEHFPSEILINACFLCTYDTIVSNGTCEYCPVDFSHINCGTLDGCLHGLYGKASKAYDKFLDNPTRDNAKAAAEICRQIANLPERKNLPGDILYTEQQAKEFYRDLCGTVYGNANKKQQGVMSIGLIADHMGISVERATEFCNAMLYYGITERSSGMIVV